jgi:hypothetical protein
VLNINVFYVVVSFIRTTTYIKCISRICDENSNIFRIGHAECVGASMLYGRSTKSDSMLRCKKKGSRYDLLGMVA